jgi:hypothetical protein
MLRGNGWKMNHSSPNRLLLNGCRTARIFVASMLALAAAAPAAGATLDALLAGGSIDAANARFRDWELVTLDATAAAPLLSQITVNALANDPLQPGIQLLGNGQLATTGLNAIDLVLRYRVEAIGGSASFTGQSLSMTGVTFGGASEITTISNDAMTALGSPLSSAVAIADHQSSLLHLTDASTFTPRLGVVNTTEIFLQGLAGGDSINLASFTLRFVQTGSTTLAGDFNNDKTVDGADFMRWQRGQSPRPLSAADLAEWRTNYGQSIAATPAVAPVAEPSSWAALVSAALARLLVLRRPRPAAPK